MPCYHPLKGFQSQTRTRTGKRTIVFNRSQGYTDLPIQIPCGQCIGCRLEKSRQWAIRCMHEASLHQDNCFITLTYDDKHLPPDLSLHKDHFQAFMRRLRRHYEYHHDKQNIRFFHCGEYGEKFARPHYHACLFNHRFEDQKIWKTVRGNKLFTSEILQDLWPSGFSTVGNVTFESAAYVARYITKKVTGKKAFEHYNTIDYKTGELLNSRIPEYTTMSRKPGIAHGWLQKFHKDVYPSDFVVVREKKMRPPKYYDNYMEHTYPSDYLRIKSLRKQKALVHSENNSPDRLVTREKVHALKATNLKRGYENDA